MNRIARFSVVVVLVAAGAFLPLLAQNAGSQKTSPQVTPSPQMSTSPMRPSDSQMSQSQMLTSPMSYPDMTAHMKGTMSHLQDVAPLAQGNPLMLAMLDRMKVLGADLRQLMDGMQSVINQTSVTQDKLKQQHLQNLSKGVQTIMLTMDNMVAELELMKNNK